MRKKTVMGRKMNMGAGMKMGLLFLAALLTLLFGVGIGSVYVPPVDILAILAERFFGQSLPDHIPANYSVMVFDMRLPRVLLAFLTGAALAVCGAVMQSLLQNPLASFGLGVYPGRDWGIAFHVLDCDGTAVLCAGQSVFALGRVLCCFRGRLTENAMVRDSGGIGVSCLAMRCHFSDKLPAMPQRISSGIGSFMREVERVWAVS